MATATKIAPSGIDIVTYLVQDLPRARKFYEEGLGFVVSDVQEVEGWQGVEYTLPSGQYFGIGKIDGPFHPSGGALVAFPDVAATTERVREIGGQVVVELMETPGCFMSVCLDTEGNTLYIHHRKDGTVA